MRNGIYTIAPANQVPHIMFVVCDNSAKRYNVSWYGNLAMWEIWETLHEAVDVSDYADNEYPEMLADMIDVGWSEVYVDFYEYDLDHLPETHEELDELVAWWKETFNE